ncbi:MAG: ureidoglycolate lyase [Hyphomicrobiales bacterium]
MRELTFEPLTREAFAPYGEVLETDGADHFPINEGTTTRFHNLAAAEIDGEGQTIISIFRGTPRPHPIEISMLERHPLGSQAFMPLSNESWLVVVAHKPEVHALKCFRACGNQGVQYAPNIWHHPLLVLVPEQDFLIVDRDGPGNNLEEVTLAEVAVISAP